MEELEPIVVDKVDTAICVKRKFVDIVEAFDPDMVERFMKFRLITVENVDIVERRF